MFQDEEGAQSGGGEGFTEMGHRGGYPLDLEGPAAKAQLRGVWPDGQRGGARCEQWHSGQQWDGESHTKWNS